MSNNKKHKETIEAWKKQEEEEFLTTIPFPESIFQELFDYLDLKLETEPCKHNFNLTSTFLASKGIIFHEHIDFFIEHGGGCDCEVLMNVEDVFPKPLDQPPNKIEKSVKREKVAFLKYQDLEIDSVPSPWRLFKSGEDYEFQFGKNQDIIINLIKNLNVSNWHDDAYWQKQWEAIVDLKIKSNKELIYDDLEGFDRVIFKTQDWTPVLTWIRRKGSNSWGLMFKTEISRFRGDINEVENLLKKIK